VRNDLPPEAEAPIIDLQTADNQFASIYLGSRRPISIRTRSRTT